MRALFEMPTAGGDWQNFQNWLNSPQGWVFYLILIIMIGLIPVLVIFLYLYRKGALRSFPAVWLWVGFGLLPALGLISSYAGATYLGGSYAPPAAAFLLISAVPLFAGIIILRRRRRFGRFPAVLIWVGLGLMPVMLALLISPWWNYFPSAGAFYTGIFSVPLLAGLSVLAIVKPLRAPEPDSKT